ncbi:hypothetical protein [Candidatus Nitrospira inopinata]|jgi:hypothetical protein|uniref:Uncharacterized protein n=1 Tax=Candidatus Nitrospira inopinata TaxID=1715989 RepID=A0A0S4KUS2_9BACT|nr:hypothetical protein [Candidatus Nitrospira inopinata]CUQ68163.1 protein of unknown function [Candidatus Nitrospira inopinata]
MTTMEQPATHSRLMDLERLVTLLNGHLRALQRELDQIDARSSAPRPWLIWPHQRRNQLLMSAICSRRIRPNLRRHDLNVSPTPR